MERAQSKVDDPGLDGPGTDQRPGFGRDPAQYAQAELGRHAVTAMPGRPGSENSAMDSGLMVTL